MGKLLKTMHSPRMMMEPWPELAAGLCSLSLLDLISTNRFSL